MDLKDYSILGAYLQIVLPWITIVEGESASTPLNSLNQNKAQLDL